MMMKPIHRFKSKERKETKIIIRMALVTRERNRMAMLNKSLLAYQNSQTKENQFFQVNRSILLIS